MFCPDRRTLGNHVDGADAEVVTAPASICLPLPDSLSDEVGALIACNFGTAFSGIKKLQPAPEDVVVVFGLGPVGCCAVLVASRLRRERRGRRPGRKPPRPRRRDGGRLDRGPYSL